MQVSEGQTYLSVLFPLKLSQVKHSLQRVMNQFSPNLLGWETMKFDYLATGGMTANQFHLAARTTERIRQQSNQRLVCGRVDRRRGHFDPQCIPKRFANFVGRGARLQFHRQQGCVRVDAQEAGQNHLY